MIKYKKRIIKLSFIFVGFLLLLTFFSNTIYTFNLPCATVAFSTDGFIKNELKGEGFVDFTESEMYYAPISGRIELFVAEGEQVEPESLLYTIKGNTEELEQSLAAALQEIDMLNFNIEKINSEIDYTRNILDNVSIEIETNNFANENEMFIYDQELYTLSIDIERLIEQLEQEKILYEAGALPESDLQEIQNKINKLEIQYSQVVEKRDKAIEKYYVQNQYLEKRAVEEYEKNLIEYKKAIKDLEYQLNEYTIKKNWADKNVENLSKQINEVSSVIISADRTGIITNISSDLEKGVFISKNEIVMKIGFLDSPFQVNVLFNSNNADYIKIGDDVILNVPSRNQYKLTGIIERIFYDLGKLNGTVVFEGESLCGGETVEVLFENISPRYENILPNSAIHKDGTDYYILYINKTKGSFGNEFYAKKMPINIIEQDMMNTAYFTITEERLPIIINTDKAVRENERVRIIDETHQRKE